MKGRPVFPPKPAVEMYSRQRVITWDEVAWKRTLILFRALKANCRFDPEPDDVWDDARQLTTVSGRNILDINCNGFAPLLRRILADGGFPMEAMSLRVCELPGPIGHMILALRTDQGTYLLCNLRGLGRADDPRWRDYRWDSGEVPGRAWESYRPTEPVGLDRLLG